MRASKACPAPTCPNLQGDCEEHDRKPWQGSTRRQRTVSGSRQQKRRRYVLRRDGNRCHRCGQVRLDSGLVADHVIPLAEGGADDVDNMAPCCKPCHDEKVQEEARRGRG